MWKKPGFGPVQTLYKKKTQTRSGENDKNLKNPVRTFIFSKAWLSSISVQIGFVKGWTGPAWSLQVFTSYYPYL